MWIAKIPLFFCRLVRKSLWGSGIPDVDSGNTTEYRAIYPLFLQVKYGGLSGVAEFRILIAEIPLIIELLTLFSAGEVRKSLRSSGIPGVDGGNTTNYRAIDPIFLQVKCGSLSGVAEFRVWIAEIPIIIELLTLFSAG